MKWKYLMVILSTSIFIACKSDPFEIKNNEQLKITTTSMGCFHFESYKTAIYKHKDRYLVSICKIHLPGADGRNYYSQKSKIEEGLSTSIWDKSEYKNFINQIRKQNDTASFSTTKVIHEIEKNGILLTNHRANINEIKRYTESNYINFSSIP
jgi:hypothetical protein